MGYLYGTSTCVYMTRLNILNYFFNVKIINFSYFKPILKYVMVKLMIKHVILGRHLKNMYYPPVQYTNSKTETSIWDELTITQVRKALTIGHHHTNFFNLLGLFWNY